MKILFESRDEWKMFDDNYCPNNLGYELIDDGSNEICRGNCEECWKEAGVELIKGYENKKTMFTIEDFKVPNTCGECKHIGRYTYGPYARNPHSCCELIWRIKSEDYRVDEKSLDENCPLIFINSLKGEK